MLTLLTRLFGSRNDRIVKGYEATVRKAASFETALQALSDEALAAKTVEFRKRLAAGERSPISCPRPSPSCAKPPAARSACATSTCSSSAASRCTRPHRRNAHRRRQDADVDAGRLSQCAHGQGVHVVTVNEYLAQRDADWMGPIYRFLGLTVGVIKNQQDLGRKRAAYRCDITYGTNNEFGFDYLRDNLALQPRRSRAARPGLRDRRRSRLDPHRRSAHAADHFRSRRREHRPVHQGQPLVPRLKKQDDEEGPTATTRSTRSRSRRT